MRDSHFLVANFRRHRDAFYHLSSHELAQKSRPTYNSKTDFPQRECRARRISARAALEKVRRDRRRGGGRRRKEKEGKSGKKREEKNASKQELSRVRSEREKETRRREALIRPSGGLKPVFVYPARREYRLSVVRLGVLHSSKYLGIFEESRVPKKTVYSVGRWRDLSRERTSEEKERRRE